MGLEQEEGQVPTRLGTLPGAPNPRLDKASMWSARDREHRAQGV